MDTATSAKVIDVVELHLCAMLAEIRTVVADGEVEDMPRAEVASEVLALPATWTEIDRLSDQTYSWPEDAGGDEEYDPFIVYRSNGTTLALAHNKKPVWIKDRPRKQVWVFQLGIGKGSKRPITPFVATDDYERTHELAAIIRGNGETGRRMFGPGESLPAPYNELRVEILGELIDGHYSKWAVVAHEDDIETMLRHGAAQARLRGF